jgi:hypothetical protein
VAWRKPFVHAVHRDIIIHELSFSSGKSGLKGKAVYQRSDVTISGGKAVPKNGA